MEKIAEVQAWEKIVEVQSWKKIVEAQSWKNWWKFSPVKNSTSSVLEKIVAVQSLENNWHCPIVVTPSIQGRNIQGHEKCRSWHRFSTDPGGTPQHPSGFTFCR
jgi:hypothetical protein